MEPQLEGPWSLPGSIDIEDEDGRRVLRLRGELDSAVVARFRSTQGGKPVVVDAIDAGDVTFISSTGLAVMLRSAEQSVAAGRTPVLRASSRPVERVMRMSLVEHVFPRTDDAPGRPEG